MRITGCICLAIVLASCSEPSPRLSRTQLENQMDVLDSRGWAGSVVKLVTEHYKPWELDTTSSHVKIIYCRNLIGIGAHDEADSLYRRYIAQSKWLSEKWRYNSEYLVMLAEQRKPARMRQYADTLVHCCADTTKSFKDMRAWHYFKANQFEGDCPECALG